MKTTKMGNAPYPDVVTSSDSLILLCTPSAAIRKSARTVWSSPESRSRSTAVTPVSSCSNERNSVPYRTSLPRRRVSASSIGSRLHGGLGAQLIQAGEKRVDVDGQVFFRTVQRRLDHHVRNSVGDGVDLVAQAQTAQDLQAAKAEISGLRVNEDLAPLFHQQ